MQSIALVLLRASNAVSVAGFLVINFAIASVSRLLIGSADSAWGIVPALAGAGIASAAAIIAAAAHRPAPRAVGA